MTQHGSAAFLSAVDTKPSVSPLKKRARQWYSQIHPRHRKNMPIPLTPARCLSFYARFRRGFGINLLQGFSGGFLNYQ